MRLLSFIFIFSLLLTLSIGLEAKAEFCEFTDDGRSLKSSFRHYMFINHDEHRSRFITSRIGGTLESTPYKGARIGWLISENKLNLWDNSLNKTKIKLNHNEKSASVNIEMPLLDVLELGSIATVSNNISRTKFNFGTRLSYSPVEALLFKIDIGKDSKSLFFDGIYDTEAVSIPFSAGWYHYSFSAYMKLHENLTLFSAINDMDFTEEVTRNTVAYSSSIYGSGNYRNLGILFERPNKGYFKFCVSRMNGSGKINLFYNNVRFGQMPRIIGNLHMWQFELLYKPILKNWKISIERIHFTGELKGNIQSWPFGDQLIDLLGLRRNFNGQADIVLWQATIENDFMIGKSSFISPTLNLFRAFPDMNFKHWQPAFLVFGVTDLQNYVSDLKRVDFGKLNISAGKKWNRLVLSCDISQFFPIQIVKFGSTDESTPSFPSDPVQISSKSKKNPLKLNSGRSIQLRLRYLF